MSDRKIGKIKSVRFGKGGYQDACIGVTFDLGSDGWGVGDFWGAWAIERSSNAKWTEASRIDDLGRMVMRVNSLLDAAKATSLDELIGKPIECTFEQMSLKSWRILTEAI
jgi:hypothetical protein